MRNAPASGRVRLLDISAPEVAGARPRGGDNDGRTSQPIGAPRTGYVHVTGKAGKPDPTPSGGGGMPVRRIDLSTLRDVRLEIESQDGTRRAYVLKTIHDVIVSAELERRIAELEDTQADTLPAQRPASSLRAAAARARASASEKTRAEPSPIQRS
jgi:hypothetical protein